MELIIDASNIKSGGGLTHLKEILRYDAPIKYGYRYVKIYSSQNTLDNIEIKPWLIKKSHKWLNMNYFFLALWKIFVFKKEIQCNNSVIFIPGTGFYHKRYVTMCQNLLPIVKVETDRFFFSLEWIRLLILKYIHLLLLYKKNK